MGAETTASDDYGWAATGASILQEKSDRDVSQSEDNHLTHPGRASNRLQPEEKNSMVIKANSV